MTSPTQPGRGPASARWGGDGREDDVDPAFLTAEYVHVSESLLRNEEDGEKRVAFFLALTSGVIAAVGLLVRRNDGGVDLRAVAESRWFIGPVLLIPLCIGWFTFARIVKRNLTTDEYKLALRTLRRRLVSPQAAGALANAFFGAYESYSGRSFSLLPFARAGWLEVVALVNALLASGLVAVLASPVLISPPINGRSAAAAGIAVVAVLVWSGQVLPAKRRYHDKIGPAVKRDEEERLGLTEPRRH